MDTFQFALIQSLNKARLVPASFDKRFIRSLARKAVGDDLSDKQAEWLLRLAYKYRRQLPAELQVKKPNPVLDINDLQKLKLWNEGSAR